MSIKSEEWGFLAKFLYKFFRPQLAKVVASTENTWDDSGLKVLDHLAGYDG